MQHVNEQIEARIFRLMAKVFGMTWICPTRACRRKHCCAGEPAAGGEPPCLALLLRYEREFLIDQVHEAKQILEMLDDQVVWEAIENRKFNYLRMLNGRVGVDALAADSPKNPIWRRWDRRFGNTLPSPPRTVSYILEGFGCLVPDADGKFCGKTRW